MQRLYCSNPENDLEANSPASPLEKKTDRPQNVAFMEPSDNNSRVTESGDSEQQRVAQLKIETRLAQLQDLCQSKGSKWQKTYMPVRGRNFDYFAFLDK